MALRPISAIKSFSARALETANISETEDQPFQAIPPVKPVSLGLAAVEDSIEDSQQAYARRFQKDPLLRALQLNLAFDALNEEDGVLSEKQILQQKQKHNHLTVRQKTLIAEKEQKTAKLSTWKTAANIAFYAVNVPSILTGLAFCSSPIAAAALTTAGTIGITSKLMEETGSFKWIASKISSDLETQNTFASYLATASTAASIGSSVIGIFLSAGTVTFNGNFLPTALTATVNTAVATTNIGSDITQASLLKTNSNIKMLDGEKKVIFNHFALEAKRLKSIANFNQDTMLILSDLVEQDFIWA